MNKVGFKKIVLAVSIMLALAFTLNACDGGKSALVGRWELVEGTDSDKELEFLSDGTGRVEKIGITWKVEKDRFHMIHPFAAISYSYKVQGSTLTFIEDNGKILKYSKK